MDIPLAIPELGASHVLDVNYIFGDLDCKTVKDALQDYGLSKFMSNC